MKDIEKILKNAANQEIQVPAKIHYRVQNVLKEKNKKKYEINIKKLVTSIASVIIVLVGGASLKLTKLSWILFCTCSFVNPVFSEGLYLTTCPITSPTIIYLLYNKSNKNSSIYKKRN